MRSGWVGLLVKVVAVINRELLRGEKIGGAWLGAVICSPRVVGTMRLIMAEHMGSLRTAAAYFATPRTTAVSCDSDDGSTTTTITYHASAASFLKQMIDDGVEGCHPIISSKAQSIRTLVGAGTSSYAALLVQLIHLINSYAERHFLSRGRILRYERALSEAREQS